MILRIEDIDQSRCRPEFRDALEEDLRWFGIEWDEGPFWQSRRRPAYLAAFEKLRAGGFIYPCRCSRKDVAAATLAPHDDAGDEPIYPGTCRQAAEPDEASRFTVNWRFRVPDGAKISYQDLRLGEQSAIAAEQFGDFIIWRRDDVPAYQLAVVADDAAMGVTEVVRGEDLLISTFRQLLLYRALRLEPPQFYHTPLVVDETGRRLAKRDASFSLRALRDSGVGPAQIRERYG